MTPTTPLESITLDPTVILTTVGRKHPEPSYTFIKLDDRIEIEITKIRSERYGPGFELVYGPEDKERTLSNKTDNYLAVFTVLGDRHLIVPPAPIVDPTVYNVVKMTEKIKSRKGINSVFGNFLNMYKEIIQTSRFDSQVRGYPSRFTFSPRQAWDETKHWLNTAVETTPAGTRLTMERLEALAMKEPDLSSFS
jgi:hypothetical protein